MRKGSLLAGLVMLALFVAPAYSTAIRPGFDGTLDGRNDDGSYFCSNPGSANPCGATATPQSFGFTINFFGAFYTQAYLNNNGNLTFSGQMSTFTPFGITGSVQPIIAPFFADVDTRNAASGVLTFGTGTVGGHNTFGVTWTDVGYYSENVDKLNSFQVLLIQREDLAFGDFDIEFNYDHIQWETGDASGGIGGLGGSPARVGWSSGDGINYYELTGSGVSGSFLDTGNRALITHSLNSNVAGRYDFFVRGGQVEPVDEVPEPATLWLLGSGLLAFAPRLRRYLG